MRARLPLARRPSPVHGDRSLRGLDFIARRSRCVRGRNTCSIHALSPLPLLMRQDLTAPRSTRDSNSLPSATLGPGRLGEVARCSRPLRTAAVRQGRPGAIPSLCGDRGLAGLDDTSAPGQDHLRWLAWTTTPVSAKTLSPPPHSHVVDDSDAAAGVIPRSAKNPGEPIPPRPRRRPGTPADRLDPLSMADASCCACRPRPTLSPTTSAS